MRSDVYSLGIILYELFTGRHPFQDQDYSIENIKKCHLEFNPPSPKIFNPNIPDSVSDIIIKCIQKDAANRFDGFAEIYHHFSRLIIERIFRDGHKKERLLEFVENGHIDMIDMPITWVDQNIYEKMFRYNRRPGVLDNDAKFVASDEVRRKILSARAKFTTGLALIQYGLTNEGTRNILAAHKLYRDEQMLLAVTGLLYEQSHYKEAIFLALELLKVLPDNDRAKEILVSCGQKLRDDPNRDGNKASLL